MMLIVLLAVAAAVALVGYVLVRVLGWPTSPDAARRWCVALLVAAFLFSASHELVQRALVALGPMPVVPMEDAIPALLVLGLAILGYVAWASGDAARAARREHDARARELPRRRAAPPPPEPHAEDEVFVPIGANDHEDAP